MDKIKVDENYRGISANCIYMGTDKVIDWDFTSDEERLKVFTNIKDYIFKDNKLTYDPLPKEEPKTMNDIIKENLNNMVLAVLPDGETLTKENVPTLVDIINPAKQEDDGTLENPIVVIDNDIAHNGYLYTYGSYYIFNGVKYLCVRQGETTGNTVKLYYTPDQLIGHYFTVV